VFLSLLDLFHLTSVLRFLHEPVLHLAAHVTLVGRQVHPHRHRGLLLSRQRYTRRPMQASAGRLPGLVRVAVCQMNAGGGDVRENVATATRLLDEAGDSGADLAALPELWPLYDTHAAMREIAAPIPGPLTDPVAEIARARSMWIVGGSVPEAA